MFKTKVFLCGNVVEVYEYDKPIFNGYKDSKGRKGRRSCASDDEKIKNREKVCRRAMNDLRRLINTNFKRGSSRFITLTFKDNVQDLKYSNYEFKKFVKRFEYYLGYKVQYTVVIEFQKRGAIHYH
ncbi:rolling circle replication-associated protein, partial [Clostridium perfringens]